MKKRRESFELGAMTSLHYIINVPPRTVNFSLVHVVRFPRHAPFLPPSIIYHPKSTFSTHHALLENRKGGTSSLHLRFLHIRRDPVSCSVSPVVYIFILLFPASNNHNNNAYRYILSTTPHITLEENCKPCQLSTSAPLQDTRPLSFFNFN